MGPPVKIVKLSLRDNLARLRSLREEQSPHQAILELDVLKGFYWWSAAKRTGIY